MPDLSFRQGIKANLPSSKLEGTIYYTNDENLLYIDKKEGDTGTLERAQITPIIYTTKECTTFTSDIGTGKIGAGTCTPAAVQKAAKQFAITRPQKKDVAQTTTDKAIARWEGTNGDVQNSKIIIEDVTNTRNTNLKAQIIAIPAEGNKKMVYGYCTDQVDGTSFLGGLFDKTATEYPYNEGLAIGGSSGNLLWKGNRVATTDMLSDTKTTQTITNTNTDYPIIFAYSDIDSNETQTTRKNLKFTYNPNLNSLSAGKKDNTSLGSNSVAIGNGVTASGPSSFATGSNTIAAGECSHAEGMGGIKESITTSLMGSSPIYTINPTNNSIVPHMAIDCNGKSSIILSYDHDTGALETLSDLGTFEEATQATIYLDGAIGAGSHVEGGGTFASGEYSHAEGYNTTASGKWSHAEGYKTTALGRNSHAEGQKTTASSFSSHAEGDETIASGQASHAEGYYTTASSFSSHAEGVGTVASGIVSHAEGSNTTASKDCSHAEGYSTTASSEYQHVQGKYNIEDANDQYAHIVGNGNSSKASNAHTLDWNGTAWFAGDIYIGSTSGKNKDEGSKKLATIDEMPKITIRVW